MVWRRNKRRAPALIPAVELNTAWMGKVTSTTYRRVCLVVSINVQLGLGAEDHLPFSPRSLVSRMDATGPPVAVRP